MPGGHLRSAVVADDHEGIVAQSCDPIEFADDAPEQFVDRQAQTFDQRQDAEAPAAVERPAQIAILRDRYGARTEARLRPPPLWSAAPPLS